MQTDTPEKITLKQWLGLIGISLMAFTIFLDITIVSNALPAIQKALAASSTELQWLPNAIYVSLCALMAVVGRIGSIYGVRKVLYSCMFLFALASLACGLAASTHQLIFFRFLQGISVASLSLTAALINHNFSKAQAAKVMGLFSAFAGSGLAIGPVVGGVIVDFWGWRWIFLIMVPVVFLGLVLCFFCVTEKSHGSDQEKLDWVGAGFFIVAISSLVTTIMQGDSWGWSSQATLIGFMLFLIATVGFIITESRVAYPIMPLKMLYNRTFIPCAFSCAATGTFIAVLLFFNPLYLQIVLQNSASLSGWLLLSISVMYVIMSPIAGVITQRCGVHTGTWIVGVFLMISGFFHALFGTTENILIILAAFIPFGLAWGAVNIAPVVAVMHSAESRYSGVLVGALWTLFNVGCAFGLAVLGIIFHAIQTKSLLANPAVAQLGEQKLSLVQQLVMSPQTGMALIQHYPAELAEQLLTAFKSSFVHGFNSISWILFGLGVVTFLVEFFIMKEVKFSDGKFTMQVGH